MSDKKDKKAEWMVLGSDIKVWKIFIIGLYLGMGMSLGDKVIWDLNDWLRMFFGLPVG